MTTEKLLLKARQAHDNAVFLSSYHSRRDLWRTASTCPCQLQPWKISKDSKLHHVSGCPSGSCTILLAQNVFLKPNWICQTTACGHCPMLHQLAEKFGSTVFSPPCKVTVGLALSWFFTRAKEPSSFSYSSQAPIYLGRPPTKPAQFLHISLELEVPQQYAVFPVKPHQCCLEEGNNFPWEWQFLSFP